MKIKAKIQGQEAFTLIELVIAIGVMVSMLSLVIAGLNSKRTDRSLNIAVNELVTNLRKAQSDTLASRSSPQGQVLQYYVLKFSTAIPTQYTIQGIYNVNSSPAKLVDIQTVLLPAGIRLKSVNPLYIVRPSPLASVYSNCALVAFKLPLAKIIINDGCSIVSAPDIAVGDDYRTIVDFVVNNSAISASADSNLEIVLTDTSGALSKKVIVQSPSGLITFQ